MIDYIIMPGRDGFSDWCMMDSFEIDDDEWWIINESINLSMMMCFWSYVVTVSQQQPAWNLRKITNTISERDWFKSIFHSLMATHELLIWCDSKRPSRWLTTHSGRRDVVDDRLFYPSLLRNRKPRQKETESIVVDWQNITKNRVVCLEWMPTRTSKILYLDSSAGKHSYFCLLYTSPSPRD